MSFRSAVLHVHVGGQTLGSPLYNFASVTILSIFHFLDKMADSDDEEILYDNNLGRNLIGGKRVKNVDDVLNGGKKDKRKLRKTLALCLAFLCLVSLKGIWY